MKKIHVPTNVLLAAEQRITMTVEQAKELPGVLGRVVPAMLEVRGWHAVTVDGVKTFYLVTDAIVEPIVRLRLVDGRGDKSVSVHMRWMIEDSENDRGWLWVERTMNGHVNSASYGRVTWFALDGDRTITIPRGMRKHEVTIAKWLVLRKVGMDAGAAY